MKKDIIAAGTGCQAACDGFIVRFCHRIGINDIDNGILT